jgi:hypothetical protein
MLVSLALTFPVAGSAHTTPHASARCAPGGGETLVRTPDVRVFERKHMVYSCWLPTRRRTFIARDEEEVPDGPAVLGTPVRIAGRYVGFAVQASGDPAYAVSNVRVVNARTGGVRNIEPPEDEEEGTFSSEVTEVWVAPNGTAVYLQTDGSPCPGRHTSGDGGRFAALIAIHRGSRRKQTLDCEQAGDQEGSISAVTVTGEIVRWLHSGTAHEASLR